MNQHEVIAIIVINLMGGRYKQLNKKVFVFGPKKKENVKKPKTL